MYYCYSYIKYQTILIININVIMINTIYYNIILKYCDYSNIIFNIINIFNI